MSFGRSPITSILVHHEHTIAASRRVRMLLGRGRKAQKNGSVHGGWRSFEGGSEQAMRADRCLFSGTDLHSYSECRPGSRRYAEEINPKRYGCSKAGADMLRRAIYKAVERIIVWHRRYRRQMLLQSLKSCGSEVWINDDVIIWGAGGVSLGDEVAINSMTHIFGSGDYTSGRAHLSPRL